MLNGAVASSVHDKVLLIRADPQFAALDHEARTLLAQFGRFQHFEPGDTIFHAGRACEDVHTLFRGEVEIRRHGAPPRKVVAPAGLGWPSLVCSLPTDEIVALTPADSLSYNAAILLDLFELNFSLVRNGLRLVSGFILDDLDGLPTTPGIEAPALGAYPTRDATFVETMLEIRDQTLFEKANFEAVAEIARAVEEVRFEKGATLWEPGDSGTYGLRLRYGNVRCTAPDGRHVTVGRGFNIGVLDSMAHRARAYAAVCETDVVAQRTDMDSFFSILEDHFDLAMSGLALLTQRLYYEHT
ncbi:MAG: hypothetical protein AB8I08_21115 [Sandaracinaceae bacterium]